MKGSEKRDCGTYSFDVSMLARDPSIELIWSTCDCFFFWAYLKHLNDFNVSGFWLDTTILVF